MSGTVFTRQIVGVVSCHQSDTQNIRDAYQSSIEVMFSKLNTVTTVDANVTNSVRLPMVHYLDVEVFSEQSLILASQLESRLFAIFDDRARDFSANTAGEHNDPFGMRTKQL